MSEESAEKFYERLENDPELTEHIRELQNPKAIGHYVRNELGYDFTLEEMQKVIFERNPEMSDEELEIVIGGLSSEQITSIVCGSVTLLGLGGLALGGFAAVAAA